MECAVVEGGVAESEPVVALRREAGVLIMKSVVVMRIRGRI